MPPPADRTGSVSLGFAPPPDAAPPPVALGALLEEAAVGALLEEAAVAALLEEAAVAALLEDAAVAALLEEAAGASFFDAPAKTCDIELVPAADFVTPMLVAMVLAIDPAIADLISSAIIPAS